MAKQNARCSQQIPNECHENATVYMEAKTEAKS